jgi:hypothetical protein
MPRQSRWQAPEPTPFRALTIEPDLVGLRPHQKKKADAVHAAGVSSGPIAKNSPKNPQFLMTSTSIPNSSDILSVHGIYQPLIL